MTAVSTEGFTLSVVNDDFEGAQDMAIKSAAADGENLVLTLTSPIYSDDTVKITYTGESITANEGYTKLTEFENKEVALEPTNLIEEDELDAHNFEDEGTNNNNSSQDTMVISSARGYGGTSNSLHYKATNASGDFSGSIIYYINSKNIANHGRMAVKDITPDEYVARIYIYQVVANTDSFQLRFKGYKSGTTTAITSEDNDRAAVTNSETIGEWVPIEATIDLSGYEERYSETLFDGVLALRFENTYTQNTAPQCEFYLDNYCFYRKSDLYRSEAGSSEIPDEPDEPVTPDDPDDEDGFTIGGIEGEGNLFGDE